MCIIIVSRYFLVVMRRLVPTAASRWIWVELVSSGRRLDNTDQCSNRNDLRALFSPGEAQCIGRA